MARQIFHITAGDEGWDPTESELNEIKELFEKAIIAPGDTAIVVTNSSVQIANVIEVNTAAPDIQEIN